MKQMRHTTPTTNTFPGIDSNIIELKRERVESHNFKAFILSSFFFYFFFSLIISWQKQRVESLQVMLLLLLLKASTIN
jgi:hypothetical protein